MAAFFLHLKTALCAPHGLPNRKKTHIITLIADPFLETDSSDCVIPFTRAGKLILVQGMADSALGNFVLDTGAPGLVLNNTYFRDYPVSEISNEQSRAITLTSEQVQHTMIDSLRLGGFHYYRVEADMISLRHIENARGVKILGLLGVSLFKGCELVIDQVHQVLRLHRFKKKEAKTYRNPLLKDNPNYTSYPFELLENRILIKTALADHVLRFVLDCAAESNLIDSRLPQKVLDSISILGRVILSGAAPTQKEALSGTMPGLALGALVTQRLPVIITSLANTCFGNATCINGVLGDDFLSHYQIAFNFVTCKMYIW